MKRLTIVLFSIFMLLCPKFVDALGLDNSSIELEEGKTQQLQITDKQEGLEYTVEWMTNKSDVATVSDDGTVTAVAEGDATITATVKHKNPENQEEFINDGQYNCTVKVNKKAETEEKLDLTLKSIRIKGANVEKVDSNNYNVTITDQSQFDIKDDGNHVIINLSDKSGKVGYMLGSLDSTNQFKLVISSKSDSKKNNTYTFKVIKPSANTYLSTLKVSGYAFNQTFDKDTLSYTLRVPYDVREIEIIAKADDANATVKGAGTKDELEVGSQTFTITVTNGSDTRTYRIFVTRDEEEESDRKKTKTISRTSKSSDSEFDIPDTEDPDSPISIAIITIGSLVLFSIGGFGIYFFIKTSPKRLKKEIMRKQKNQEESPIVEINNNHETDEPTKEFK